MPMTKEDRLKLLGGTLDFLLLQRKYKDVLELAQNTPDDVFSSIPHTMALKYFVIGIARKALGDEKQSRAAFLKAKGMCDEDVKQKQDDPDAHIQLGKLEAWLGEKTRP